MLSQGLSWVCRMLALAILTRHWPVGRHVGDMLKNVGPTFGDICLSVRYPLSSFVGIWNSHIGTLPLHTCLLAHSTLLGDSSGRYLPPSPNSHVCRARLHCTRELNLIILFRIPHMPPAGSLKVLHAPVHWGGIRRASQTKIYNLETDEFVSNPPFLKINLAGVISHYHFGGNN